jgi:hypothetical protein
MKLRAKKQQGTVVYFAGVGLLISLAFSCPFLLKACMFPIYYHIPSAFVSAGTSWITYQTMPSPFVAGVIARLYATRLQFLTRRSDLVTTTQSQEVQEHSRCPSIVTATIVDGVLELSFQRTSAYLLR